MPAPDHGRRRHPCRGKIMLTSSTPKLPRIFDSHAHYDDEQFDLDRESLLSRTLPEKGVVGILNLASDLESGEKTLDLVRRFPQVYGGAGIHPECAASLPADWLSQVENMLCQEKMVAVGEIGLDYHWLDLCPKDRQKEVFAAQLELANRLSLPVVVHDREAHADTLALLQEYRPKGVVHCFSGSVETARELINLGLYLGFGGAVTFKNARHSPEVAREIPLDRLLLETDAPYMAPVPYRGKRNDSSLISYVAEKIGEIRGESPGVILEAAEENARRLFSLPQ